MLSRDPEVLRNSHLGIGRSLFQLGWLELDGKPYPSDASETPPMEEFDELVRAKLAAMRESNESADTMRGMRSLIVNWTDAVRHFDSAGPQPDAIHNREVAMTYLNRLRELLEEERQQTEDSMPQPQPQPGEGQPQEGEPQEGEGGEPKDKGKGGQDEPRESGEGGEKEGEPREGDQGDEREPGERKGKPEPKDEPSGKEPVDPNESPEERARRILGDNTDLEKGAPIPGRVEYNPPEKDW
jgi:hypothetical protein